MKCPTLSEKKAVRSAEFSKDRQLFSGDVRDVGALSDDFLDERRAMGGKNWRIWKKNAETFSSPP